MTNKITAKTLNQYQLCEFRKCVATIGMGLMDLYARLNEFRSEVYDLTDEILKIKNKILTDNIVN